MLVCSKLSKTFQVYEWKWQFSCKCNVIYISRNNFALLIAGLINKNIYSLEEKKKDVILTMRKHFQSSCLNIVYWNEYSVYLNWWSEMLVMHVKKNNFWIRNHDRNLLIHSNYSVFIQTTVKLQFIIVTIREPFQRDLRQTGFSVGKKWWDHKHDKKRLSYISQQH